MNEQGINAVAEGMVLRLAQNMALADRLAEIGSELAQQHGLTQEEKAAAFDRALVALRELRAHAVKARDQQMDGGAAADGGAAVEQAVPAKHKGPASRGQRVKARTKTRRTR